MIAVFHIKKLLTMSSYEMLDSLPLHSFNVYERFCPLLCMPVCNPYRTGHGANSYFVRRCNVGSYRSKQCRYHIDIKYSLKLVLKLMLVFLESMAQIAPVQIFLSTQENHKVEPVQ